MQNSGGEIVKNKDYGNLYLSGAVTSVVGGYRACKFGQMCFSWLRNAKLNYLPDDIFITFNIHRHVLPVFHAVLLKLMFHLLRFICYRGEMQQALKINGQKSLDTLKSVAHFAQVLT